MKSIFVQNKSEFVAYCLQLQCFAWKWSNQQYPQSQQRHEEAEEDDEVNNKQKLLASVKMYDHHVERIWDKCAHEHTPHTSSIVF